MLVQCPNCRTTYKVSDDILKGSPSAFRCSRCKHTFELEAGENMRDLPAKPKGSDMSAAKPARDEELSLPLAPKQESDPVNIDKKHVDELPIAPGIGGFESKHDEHAQWAISDSNPGEERAFVMAEPGSSMEPKKKLDPPSDFPANDPLFRKLETDDEGENSNNILAISPYLDQRASVLPFVTLFSLLAIAFSLFAVISHAHPEVPESTLKNIPMLGAIVLKNNHLKEGILIKSLGTGYQRVQGNREVFMVTGIALNQNPVVLREVQLTGKIYNETGKEIERQTIWVGNTLSPKILRGMTLEDIPQLQDLKPLKSFEIPPGDSVPFTIVFLRSAKSAKEFTCAVSTATGES
jgi:predicted Zn finger-like uncharacterized protein